VFRNISTFKCISSLYFDFSARYNAADTITEATKIMATDDVAEQTQ